MYYAVKSVDGIPVNQIYTEWDGVNGCRKIVEKHRSVFKGFKLEADAQTYLRNAYVNNYGRLPKNSSHADEMPFENTKDSDLESVSELHGTYVDVKFENEDTGYCIFVYKTSESGRITCIGYNLPKEKNSTCVMHGNFKKHPKYGLNFEVNSYEIERKSNKAGVIEFLCLLNGIGKVLAERIWKTFGKDTYRILEEDISRLVEVSGISPKKAESIKKAYADMKTLTELSKFLIEYNISPKYAKKVNAKYGVSAIDTIKKNPYVLFEVSGITFELADNVAMKMNKPKDSAERFNACVRSVLIDGELDGNTGMEISELQRRTFRLLKMDTTEESQKEWLRMIKDKELHIVRLDVDGNGVKQYVFSDMMCNMEKKCAELFTSLCKFKPKADDIEEVLVKSEASDESGLLLDGTQVNAVINALSHSVSVIIGEPGTGKTTTIKKVNECAGMMYPEMDRIFLAPTGRASRRMTESIGEEAETVHHKLELGIQENKIDRSDILKLENAVITVDEFSMVDIYLMYNLLKAVQNGCILILVGDINQLPSVGAGRVLQDVIESKLVPVTELKHIHRQDLDAKIYINAHNINNGIHDIEDGSDFKFHEETMSEETEREMVNRVVEQTEKYGLGNVMCLCPYKKGLCGVERMNTLIQERLNPKRDAYATEAIANGYTIRTGDMVMQIKRNTEEASNGDIGFVKDVNVVDGNKKIYVQFNKDIVEYDKSDFEYLTLAYATTVHKSQGSEADAVITCLWNYHSKMKYRAIPYVAISRGKKMVDFYGSRSALDEAIDNIQQLQRVSLFGRFLTYNAGGYIYA